MKNIKSKTQNNRVFWIDILRALAMFLVIFGHTYNNSTFYQIINPFKMPLFYFLSGIFLTLNKSFLDYVKGIAYRFIIPWLIFSLLPLRIIIFIMNNNSHEAINYTREFLLGGNYWFITSFIVTQLLCYLIYHILKKNEIITLIVTLVLFYLGVALRNVEFMSIWCMDTALTGTLFVMLGKIFNSNKTIIMDKYLLKTSFFIISLTIYFILVIITIHYYPNQTMDFHNTKYYNTIICLIMIITGISNVIFVASKIKNNHLTNLIATMGQNTLVVYLLNGPVVGTFVKIYFKFFHCTNVSFVVSFILTVIACAISTIISVICGKYCPILIGKKKKV